MSPEIVIPGKSFGSVVAICEFAKVSVFLFLGAVAGGYVAFNISGPIETPIACRFRAGKVSAMGLDMFANRTPVRAIHAESRNAENLAIRTGAQISAGIALGTLDKISDLK